MKPVMPLRRKFSMTMCVLGLAIRLAPAWAQQELRFFNWSDYLPDEVLEHFTAETGIPVRQSTYDSNEAMYAKLKLLDGKGYDLAVPSTYYVDKMRKEGLLLPLDKTRLPGFTRLDPRHLNQVFDPGNLYSLPFLWGTTGILVDSTKFDPATVQHWSDLWNPRFRGLLLFPNDMREIFHMAMFTLGFSGNTTHPAEIHAAYEKLRSLMPNARLFNSDSPVVLFVTGEVDAGMMWNGNAYQARKEAPNLRYIHPRDGTILWMDSLVIPKGAENPDGAHLLLEFLLRPDIAALISSKIGYASPNLEAIKQLPAVVRDDLVVYPPDEILQKGEYQTDIGESITVYTEYWERLRAGE